jgi:glycosyltransferase involved in cell wall biosynthesis
MTPEISVVILCYKEGKRLSSFVNRTVNLLERSFTSWEIVLVANYWDNITDDTPGEARKIALQRSNIKAVTMLKKGGMGWDTRNGLKEACGIYICLIDGDGQVLPEDIIRVYDKIKSEKLDFVTTYRVKRGDGLLRKANSYTYNLVFRLLFPGISVRDANAKPKIFTKEAYSNMCLTANDWFIDAEMLIQRARLKLKIGEIPVTFDNNINRKSFVRFDAIFEFIKNLLRARIKEFSIKK